MKKVIISIFLFSALSLPISMRGSAITVDPALTAAIIAQTTLLQDQYKKRSENHNKIQIAQAAITLAVDNIHKVEEKVLEYMANASGVMQNLYQLKQIAELTAVDIPNNLSQLSKDIPSNIKGTAITLFVNKTVAETTTDIVALADIIQKLVTSKYSLSEIKDKDNPNINLLSAAERYTILQDVLFRLNRINRRIYLTNFYIKTFGWRQLWMGIDRQSWCNAVYGRIIARDLINKWNRL